jgi:HK97 gp10 family phage protein
MAQVELNGMKELLVKLQQLGNEAGQIENQALRSGAEIIRKEASTKVSRSKRSKKHLADNITISNVRKQEGVKYILIGPTKGDHSPFFYGKFLEWGTSKMSARPFMGPAVAEKEKEVVKTMSDVICSKLS